ncbi:MAG: hypothetical protein Q9219_006509 [cf. Caloplaca sp. 3 TL-2023]
MLIPTSFTLLTSLFLPLSSSAPAPYPNALALINAQPDLTIIATLINRDPELINLYQSVKDVTIFTAPDDTFPNKDLNVPPFTDKPFARAVLRQIIVEGIHPTSEFTAKPKYYKSKLTDPDYVNLSLGAAVARLVRLNNQNNFLAGGGLSANVLESGANLPFTGGIVHKVDSPINVPLTIPATFSNAALPVAPNYSILNASAFGLLDTLNNKKDVTIFALTNDAFTAAVKKFVSSKQCLSESVAEYLQYYAIAPGVYYGNSFTGKKVQTLSGESVTLSGAGKFPKLKVNDANVVTPDVFVKNGVVHVLDRPVNKMASHTALFSTSMLKAANARPYSDMDKILDPALSRNLRDMGMVYMTPVQEKVLAMPSLRQDCLVRSKTGTGKTIAFLLPALQTLLHSFPLHGRVAILILSPTRELALQIAAEAKRLVDKIAVRGKEIEVHTAFGGTARASNLNKFINGDPKILVATPGRLNDILEEQNVKDRFTVLQTLIIDEADAMLEAGFLPAVQKILKALPSKAGGKKGGHWQGMCFSATVPQKIKEVLPLVLNPDYTTITTLDESEPPTIQGVPQFSITIPKAEDMFATLLSLINHEVSATDSKPKIIVFGTTANLVAVYAEIYKSLLDLEIFELHSRLSQNQRTKTADTFREATSGIMFATDVIGRGMDFPDVTLVVQAGLPMNTDAYTHRVGRTARAGKSGRAIIVLSEPETFYLRVNPQFPITPYPDPEKVINDHASKARVEQAMANIDEKTKQKAYQAFLGFMKPFESKLRMDSKDLVQMVNSFAKHGLRCPEPPAMERKVVGKMGLKGVPGIRYAQPEPKNDSVRNEGAPKSYANTLKRSAGQANASNGERSLGPKGGGRKGPRPGNNAKFAKRRGSQS